jgi:non-specific protein-tyrosine kinase
VELRHYLDILKRQKWLVIEAVVIVAVVAGVLSNMKTPVYSASARVLLRPNDPAEQLYPGYNITGFSDPDRYVSAQIDIIQSEGVAKEAAKDIKGVSPDELLGEVSASQAGTSDVLQISGTSIDPERARDVANAFARAYIENRRQYAVAGLQRASDDISKKLADLEQQIAKYDAQIGDGGVQLGATAAATPPGPDGTGLSSGIAAPQLSSTPGTGLNDGAQPTNDNALKAARYAAATQYQSLYFRQQELLVDINLKRGEAEMVSSAETPSTPISPKPKKDAMLGGFLGLLLGLGIAFLREQIDDRLRTREDVEHSAKLPIIAELPLDEDSAKHPSHLASAEHSLGGLAEATRSLRSSVQFLGVEKPVHTLVVTSPGPGDGKSLVAANLATVYAQAGFRTVLVSSDLRRPRLEEIFTAHEASLGLSGVLASMPTLAPAAAAADANGNGSNGSNSNGNGHSAYATETMPLTTVAGALQETSVENLRFLPAGVRPPNPAELFGSRRMTELLTELRRSADVVIFDTPPVLAVTDAAVLAAQTDGVLLVASLGETHRGALARSRETLEAAHARILGLVLNKVEQGGGYGYYGYYGYYGDGAAPKQSRLAKLLGRKPQAPNLPEGEGGAVVPDRIPAGLRGADQPVRSVELADRFERVERLIEESRLRQQRTEGDER